MGGAGCTAPLQRRACQDAQRLPRQRASCASLVSHIPRQSSGWLTDGFVEAAPLLASADSPRFPPSGEPRAGPAALRRSRGRRTGAGHRALGSQVHPPGSFPTQLDSDGRAAGAQVHVLMYRGGLRGEFMCDGGLGVVCCSTGSGWFGCVWGGPWGGQSMWRELQWPCGDSEKLLQGTPPSLEGLLLAAPCFSTPFIETRPESLGLKPQPLAWAASGRFRPCQTSR